MMRSNSSIVYLLDIGTLLILSIKDEKYDSASFFKLKEEQLWDSSLLQDDKVCLKLRVVSKRI